MLLNKYLSRASNVFSLNRILLITTLVMLAVTILLVQTINRQVESRTTVLVPLTSTGAMEVGYDEASPDYLRAIARYIINLAFTYTSESARSQFEELLTLFAPEQREAERRRWLALADKIKKVQRVSRAFFIDDIRKKSDANTLIVKGSTARRLGNTLEIEPAVLELDYRIDYGRFMLLSMRRTNVQGDQRPRISTEYVKQVIDKRQDTASEDRLEEKRENIDAAH